MGTSKGRTTASWILVVLLAALYLMAAVGKLSGAATAMFEGWGYPAWFAILIGVAELAGAIGLLVPRTTRYAVIGLALIMLGAAYTHLSHGEGLQVLRPVIFLAGLGGIWLLRSPTARG
ncbi:MAG: DoxX family protein [Acidobacteriota bacterium]|nr:DoxX family protein [Acidobacteriota bacterium]MDH3522520.1 DoxX family protein [Acidobacteriota bacterium]